jgi:hypothetical protein
MTIGSPPTTREVMVVKKLIVVLATSAMLMGATGVAHAGAGTSDVRRFSDGSAVPGAWSRLVTTRSGASMDLHTSGLTPGDVVTVWWVVFNAPQNCTHREGPYRCGPGDLPPYGGDGSAQPSVLYATGHVIGGSGASNFGAHLVVGDTSGALFGPGLTNPLGADIHLVLHDHGPADPAIVAAEIHSFGVCNLVCTDVQFSVHEQ